MHEIERGQTAAGLQTIAVPLRMSDGFATAGATARLSREQLKN